MTVEKVHWLANEGVRISKLIADIQQQVAAPGFARSTLVDDLITDATGAKPFAGPPVSVFQPPGCPIIQVMPDVIT
ncbi:hypothetical protein NL154_28255 (plasmid) [Rhizobium sp. YTUHZ044]|uniref:hypothetical protein n=1 Tax=Rhizobium sp. YTUHZ044 TaxID=2962678 RepID=UPI003DA9344C